MPVMEGTPEDALEVLLLMRSGSTMVGESRSRGRFKNISPSGLPWCPETLMATGGRTRREAHEDSRGLVEEEDYEDDEEDSSRRVWMSVWRGAG